MIGVVFKYATIFIYMKNIRFHGKISFKEKPGQTTRMVTEKEQELILKKESPKYFPGQDLREY